MQKGRPRKPTSLHLAEGTYRPDEHAERLKEPKPIGVPDKPEWLSQVASDHWDAVVPGLIETRVATSADSASLAMMCHWWSEWHLLATARAEALATGKNPSYLINTLAVASKQWNNLACRFGLTPVDRARIVADVQTDEEEMDALIS